VISDNLLRFDETIRRMNSESSLLQTQVADLSRVKLSHVTPADHAVQWASLIDTQCVLS
jgi:hypothetical protein